MNITVKFTGEPAKLEVESGSGRELLEIETNDGESSGSLQVTAGQTYFIRLRSAEKAASNYLVDLAFAQGI